MATHESTSRDGGGVAVLVGRFAATTVGAAVVLAALGDWGCGAAHALRTTTTNVNPSPGIEARGRTRRNAVIPKMSP